jgi:hypothetical protein
MNRRSAPPRLAAATVAALALVAGAALLSQPETPPATAPAAEAADDPGDQHAMLTALAGEWRTRSTLRMDGVPPPPDGDTGQARVEPILDGRFIAIHETGDMLGQQQSSLKIFGYNNAAALYEATWIYTGSTAMMRARGQGSADTGVLTFQAQYATAPDQSEKFIITLSVPAWGGQGVADPGAAEPPQRFTIALVALLPDGAAGPALETVYTRAP